MLRGAIACNPLARRAPEVQDPARPCGARRLDQAGDSAPLTREGGPTDGSTRRIRAPRARAPFPLPRPGDLPRGAGGVPAVTRSESWNPLLRSLPDSRKLAGVSWAAEALYLRLLASTGDDGLAPAHPLEVLTAALGERARRGQVTLDDVAGWLDELEAAALLRRYEADGRPYLALLACARYVKRSRFRRSSCPEPPWPILGDADGEAGGLLVVNAEPDGRRPGDDSAPGWRPGGADPAPHRDQAGAGPDAGRRQLGADEPPEPRTPPADAVRADSAAGRQGGADPAPGWRQGGASRERARACALSSSPALTAPPPPNPPKGGSGAESSAQGGAEAGAVPALESAEAAWAAMRREVSEARRDRRPPAFGDQLVAGIFRELFEGRPERVLDVEARQVPVLFAQFRRAWRDRQRAARSGRRNGHPATLNGAPRRAGV